MGRRDIAAACRDVETGGTQASGSHHHGFGALGLAAGGEVGEAFEDDLGAGKRFQFGGLKSHARIVALRFAGSWDVAFREPGAGLEPATPSLPWMCSTN